MKKTVFVLILLLVFTLFVCACTQEEQAGILCSACNAKISSTAKFCPECGAEIRLISSTPIQTGETTPSTTPSALPTETQLSKEMKDALEGLDKAKAQFEKKNWDKVIYYCDAVAKLVPNTDLAKEAKELAAQALMKKESQELAQLMYCLEEAYNSNDWAQVVAYANAIIDGYTSFPDEVAIAKQKKQVADIKVKEISDKDVSLLLTKLKTAYDYSSWETVVQFADKIINEYPQYKTEVSEAKRLKGIAVDKLCDAALAKLQKNVDEVENRTWYFPASKPKYINDYSVTYMYIGQNESGHAWLRWRIVYVDDDWLFFDEIIINVDGKIWTLTDFEHDEYFRNNNSKNVWEYLDISPEKQHLDVIRAIIKSEKTIIRFKCTDDNVVYDYVVTQAEKDGFQDILDAYAWMTED